MRNPIHQFAAHPVGAAVFLISAAFLEAYADSFFHVGIHRASGVARLLPLLVGTGVLALYGIALNLPDWDFGKLIGIYVVVFFLAAQCINWWRFHQAPSRALCVGGSLIAAGGVVIALWRS